MRQDVEVLVGLADQGLQCGGPLKTRIKEFEDCVYEHFLADVKYEQLSFRSRRPKTPNLYFKRQSGRVEVDPSKCVHERQVFGGTLRLTEEMEQRPQQIGTSCLGFGRCPR